MARKSLEQIREAWHAESMAGFSAAYDATIGERRESLQDRRFATIRGAQYEGDLAQQFANKPKFELNLIGRALQKLEGDYRKQRITVDFVPRDGGDSDEMADALDGMYRADEQDSDGREAMDVAFREGVSGGFGAWRYVAVRVNPDDDEDERQRIAMEPIYEADRSVFFDIGCRKYDKSDAERAWVLTAIPRKVYEAKYSDSPSSWPSEVSGGANFDWFTPDVVTIAESYAKRTEIERYEVWASPTDEEQAFEAEDLDEVPDGDETELTKREQLEALGWRFVREKKKRCTYVEKCIESGGKVLDGPERIAGKHIPIAPFYGNRAMIEGIERWWGEVRPAKDAQRLTNMEMSLLAELAASKQKEVPIFLSQQVRSPAVRNSWASGDIENHPYRIIDAIINQTTGAIDAAGPVGYDKPPSVPPAMGALLQLSDGYLTRLLGGQGEAKEVRSNVSADAVELIQTANDVVNAVPLDNLAKSVRRGGEIWLGMAREIYVEHGRKIKTVASDGTTGNVELGRLVQAANGLAKREIDLSDADYQVTVSTGPTSESARSSTVRALAGMAQMSSDPETSKVLTAAALTQMDGEGLSGIRDYFRRFLVQVGAQKPTDEEAEQMQTAAAQQQPDAQTAYLLAEAQKSMAATQKSAAETEKIRAQTAEILSGMDQAQRAQVIAAIQAIAGLKGQQPMQ